MFTQIVNSRNLRRKKGPPPVPRDVRAEEFVMEIDGQLYRRFRLTGKGNVCFFGIKVGENGEKDEKEKYIHIAGIDITNAKSRFEEQVRVSKDHKNNKKDGKTQKRKNGQYVGSKNWEQKTTFEGCRVEFTVHEATMAHIMSKFKKTRKICKKKKSKKKKKKYIKKCTKRTEGELTFYFVSLRRAVGKRFKPPKFSSGIWKKVTYPKDFTKKKEYKLASQVKGGEDDDFPYVYHNKNKKRKRLKDFDADDGCLQACQAELDSENFSNTQETCSGKVCLQFSEKLISPSFWGGKYVMPCSCVSTERMVEGKRSVEARGIPILPRLK